jgi:long-chain acyl-CoA synthetase
MDMFVRGSENIYPKEIESVLTAFDGVLDSARSAPDRR